MTNKQDSYWMEFTLDEKVDQKVCEYLREHHAEYRNTKQKMKELMEQYPNVQAVFETDDAVTLTAEEHLFPTILCANTGKRISWWAM